MSNPSLFFQRTYELALLGGGFAFPNPRVGCVIVHNNRIIGEGYHRRFGKGHAEVEAINSVKEKHLIPDSTLYVSMEPCAHQGKTPSCAELVVKHNIKRIGIGMTDPNPLVKDKGVAILKSSGAEVFFSDTPQLFYELNPGFIKNYQQKLPFITLKWAESSDGLIAGKGPEGNFIRTKISGEKSQFYTHFLRSEHQAIMVGKKTLQIDNPSLSTRKFPGYSPQVITFEPETVSHLKILEHEIPPIFISDKTLKKKNNLPIEQGATMREIFRRLNQVFDIQSILVEGGRFLLEKIIKEGVFDQVFVIKSKNSIGMGLSAPILPTGLIPTSEFKNGPDIWFHYINKDQK